MASFIRAYTGNNSQLLKFLEMIFDAVLCYILNLNSKFLSA